MHRYTPGITETTILFIAQCSASNHPPTEPFSVHRQTIN